MFGLGWAEVVIILIVALVIFGPKKLPELGRSLAKTLKGFNSDLAPLPKIFDDGNSELRTQNSERIKERITELN